MPEKIAFMFLTRGEVNNVNVWEKYFQDADSSKYRIVIHPKNPLLLTSNLWANSTILKPIPTAWGTISLVKATIHLLQTAITDPSVTKFILLSEFCLPTTNFNSMYSTIMSETNLSRINWNMGKNMDRYSIIKSYLNMPAHNWAKQSQWMCLDRKHVTMLLSPMNTNILNQQLKDYMYCPAPDEHFFINNLLYTIRINNNEIINHPITFVDWSNNSKHPVTFNTIVSDVIELCRKNKIFFARKFVNMSLTSQDIEYLLQPQSTDSIIENLESEINLELENIIPIIQTPINVIKPVDVTSTTDKQKEAVLNFFKDIITNLSPQKIDTIYSALFIEETIEEPSA
jgi:hypothetical protein